MINRGSRRNEGNFNATTGFCKILPSDIKEANLYYDWYQSTIPTDRKCDNG